MAACDLFSPGLGEIVDVTAPVITVESHNNGAYVGSIFTLSGSVSDDKDVKSVTLNDGTTTYQAQLKDNSWSVQIDSTGLPDGDRDYVITAEDSSGKSITQKILLTIDNNPPTVLVSTPTEYGPDVELNKFINIKGEAADTTRVKEVRVFVYKTSDDSPILNDTLFPGSNTTNIATGTSSWYYVLDASSIGASGVEVYFNIVAEDYSGNKNSYFYHFDDVLNASSDPAKVPSIEEINANDYQGLPIPATDLVDVDALPDGSSTDTIEDIRLSVSDKNFTFVLDDASDKPYVTYLNPSYTDKNLPTGIDPSDLTDPSENVLSLSQRLTGFAEDDDWVNYSSVKIAIWDGAVTDVFDDPTFTEDDTIGVITGTAPLAGYQWVSPTINGNQWKIDTSLPTGEYQFRLYVEDIYGEFFVSPPAFFSVAAAAPPNVTITSPNQGSYLGLTSTLTIEANVTNLGSGSVMLDLNADGDWSDALPMTDTGDGIHFTSGLLTAGVDITTQDGPVVLPIRAGTTGSLGYADLQLTGDIQVPSIQTTYPAESDEVNGSINITGSSNDDNQIQNVYLNLVEGDEPALLLPPADWTGWTSPDGTDLYNWIYNVDTTSLNNTTYTLHYFAVDGAGNISVPGVLHFDVDQSSDIPVFNLSNMTLYGTTVENGYGKDASIIGLVEDDDLVDVSSLKIRIDIYGDGVFTGQDLTSNSNTLDMNESEAWIDVSTRPAADSRIVSWSHNLLNLPQGVHRVAFEVSDSNGTTLTTGFTDFIIDYGPPSLAITAPSNGTLQNADFSIYGTASDPNGVNSIELFINGGPAIDVMVEAPGTASATWNYDFTVASNGSTDGDYSYQIQATDMSNGKTTMDRQFVVDATAPTITIETPGVSSTVNGSTVNVQGVSNDNRAISQMYYTVTDNADTPPVASSGWNLLGGLYSWSFTLNSLVLNGTDSPSNHTIWLRSEDTTGNLSIDYSRAIIIDQKSDRPVISFNDIDKNETDASNNVLVGATQLTGLVEDDDLIDPALFGGNSIEINIDEAGWGAVSAPPAASGKVVVWKHDISTLTEGLHRVKVRARDNQSNGLVGSSSIDALFFSNFNWNILDSTDQNGVPFILNLGPPSITVDQPDNYSFHSSDVTISGSSADANGVKFIDISYDNGISWSNIADYSGAPISPAPWSTSYTVTGSNDGTVTYILRVTDAFDSSSIFNGQFTVDANAPTALIEQPSNGETVNGTITLRGTAEDTIALNKVYYIVQPKYTNPPVNTTLNSVPAYPADYTAFTGNYSWNHSLATTDLNNEIYTLWVTPVDEAGNVGSAVTVDFTVDQNSDKPVIYYTSVTDGGSYVDNQLPLSKQISGYIEDDDIVQADSIQYKLFDEGGTLLTAVTPDWTDISGQPSLDKSPVNWNHTLGGAISDGKYQIQLRAADGNDSGSFTPGGFGWTETSLVKMVLDTASPVTTFTSPLSNGGYTNQDFTVSGLASDQGGVKTIEIQFSGYPLLTLLADSGGPYNTTESWSYDFDHVTTTAPLASDGLLEYQVLVTDAYDKVKTYDRYITVDTQVPDINSLLYLSNDSNAGEVNGSVLIQGFPVDNETLISSLYLLTTQTVPGSITDPGADPVGEGWTLLGSTTTINHRLDSTLLDNSTDYYTYLIAEDLAGNRTTASDNYLSFYVDQSNNLPVITFDTANNAVLTTSNSIQGSINDDDGVDIASIEISTDGGSTWGNVSSTEIAGATQVNFSHSLSGLSERIAPYSIQVRASDTGETFAEPTQNIASASSSSSLLSVNVDDSDPTASITLLDNGRISSATLTGVYVNDQFVLTGTATDGVQIASVRAKLAIAGDDYDTVAVLDTDGDTDISTPYDTWEWTRSGLSLTGESVVLSLEVTDIHGNPTEYNHTLLVDTTAPTLSISSSPANPNTATGAYNGDISFRGTASDNMQIAQIYYRFDTSEPTTSDPVADGWTLATGTYSWTVDLDSTTVHDLESDFSYWLGVSAVDSAGNVSTTTETLNLNINQSSDRPVLTLSQPIEGGLLETNAKVIGSLVDDDGLNSLEIRIDLNDDGDFDDADEEYQPVSQPALISGNSINFEDNLSTLADGSYRIQLRASDSNDLAAYDPARFGWTESAVISFDIDTLAPALSLDQISVQSRYGGADKDITSNFNGSYINNDSTLYFQASDSSGIAFVQVSTDGGSSWGNATSLGGDNYSITITVPSVDLTDGTENLLYRARDGRGKTTSSILTLVVDTTEPTIEFSLPASVTTSVVDDAPNVNGDVSIRGAVNDSSSISTVEILGGIAGDVVMANSGNTISWKTSLASSDLYANSTYAYNTGDTGASPRDGVDDADETWTNIWRFPLELTATDLAGNRVIQFGYVDIDPDGDKPLVSVVAPSSGDSVSGTFLINGSITDDDGTDYVELQLDFDGDGNFDDSLRGAGGNLSISNDLNENTVSDDSIDESTAIQLPGGTGSWSIALNASDFTLAKLNAAGYSSATGYLGLQLTPYDINGTPGNVQTLSIYLDTTSPVVSGLDIDGTTEVVNPTPATGSLQKGQITLRARFEDDKELLNSSMLISLDGGATFNAISSIAGAVITDQLTTAPYKYFVEVPIDTSTALAGGNGILSIQLNITDKTNKQNSASVTYNVDNNLPVIQWNADGSGTLQDLPFIGTPPAEIYSFNGNESTLEADDAYKVLGAATDTGTISGIDKVHVYFVKNGQFISPENGDLSPVVNSDVADNTGSLQSIPFTEDSHYVIAIDNRIEQGLFDQTGGIGDFDGYEESLKAKSGYDEWYAFFDTTSLPDGPLDIYSVVYDQAGNTSYVHSLGQIANDPPSIPSIDVGTDTIDDSNQRTKIKNDVPLVIYGVDATGIVVNDIQLDILNKYSVGTGGSIGTAQPYTPVSYSSTDFVVTPGSGSTAENASITLITEGADFTGDAWYLMEASVSDTDGNKAIREFYVWVNNADTLAPIVTLDEITQDSIALVDGHVVKATDSHEADNQADISGTVKLTGTVYDDTQVDSLTVEISQDNGTSWTDAGTALLGSFTGNSIDGFTYNWSFDWNTASITNVADLDVQVRAYGTDGTNTTLAGDRPGLTVDVVPYITSLERDSNIYSTNRSKRGHYDVQEGETNLKISGYNLRTGGTGDWLRIYNSGESNNQTVTVSSSANAPDELTLTMAGITYSGYLRISVNSVEDNNYHNSDLLSQNKEDDGSGLVDTLWNDDRYLNLWDVSEAFSASSDAQFPAMEMDDSNGDLIGSWAHYLTTAMRWGTPTNDPGGAGASVVDTSTDLFEYNDIAVDTNGDFHLIFLDNLYYNFGFATWGYLHTWDSNGNRDANVEQMGNGSNASPDHSDGRDEYLYQFQNPKIMVVDDYNYVVYYDAWAQALKYGITQNQTATYVALQNYTNGQYIIAGQDDFDNDPSDSGDKVGVYSAIGMDPDDNRIVTVFYNETSKNLQLARGAQTHAAGNPAQNNANNGDWTLQDITVDNGYIGSYVNMAIDPVSGDLHIIAYRVSNGDLIYIHADDVDGAATNYSFDAPVVIDSTGNVGKLPDITLMGSTPYVSYLSGDLGTFDGVKYARYTGAGGTGNWASGDDWEYGIVPSDSPVLDFRTSIEAYTGAAWGNVAVAYGSDYYSLAYLQGEQ